MSAIAMIKRIRNWSDKTWDMAIETAGPEYGGSAEKVAEMQANADSCLESYDAAIKCLREQSGDWAMEARNHLKDALALEDEGGDSSHARMALEALDEESEP